MRQSHRYLAAVLVVLLLVVPGAFARSPADTLEAASQKAYKIKPYKATKINRKSNMVNRKSNRINRKSNKRPK